MNYVNEMKEIDEYTFRKLVDRYPNLTCHSIHFCSPFITMYYDANLSINNELPYNKDNVYLQHLWGGIALGSDTYHYNKKLIPSVQKATKTEINNYKLLDSKTEARRLKKETRNNKKHNDLCDKLGLDHSHPHPYMYKVATDLARKFNKIYKNGYNT